MSNVYLLHFDRQHYLGYTKRLRDRIEAHRQGQGSRLCAVATERGIGFEVARTWTKGTRQLERQLKRRKAAHRLCPICKAAKLK
ncbi:MAG: endonuclease [Gammaproteobacteria bacterium]|nr:MAG: endonuclease [Gammaproteobacteria bacterium]